MHRHSVCRSGGLSTQAPSSTQHTGGKAVADPKNASRSDLLQEELGFRLDPWDQFGKATPADVEWCEGSDEPTLTPIDALHRLLFVLGTQKGGQPYPSVGRRHWYAWVRSRSCAGVCGDPLELQT
jgi:hypothetical protein